MNERQQLETAISSLEGQRGLLGDAIVDAAVAPMRARLVVIAGAETSPAVAAESLRLVTILFVDMVGSTTLAARLDVEDMLELFSGALAALAKVVESHEGWVTKFTGDGFKAVFGAAQAREDDAERAVRSGLAVIDVARRHAAALRAEREWIDFQVRVGIHTGHVALGGGIEGVDTVMGGAVHIAARMEQAAPPGRLLISHDTYRHVRGLFACEAQPPLSVKGVEGAMLTYLVNGPNPRVTGLSNRGIEGIATPMIGRDAELQLLIAAHERVAHSGKSMLVVVVADAGIGKTRLLAEFSRWTTSCGDGAGDRGSDDGSIGAPTMAALAQPHGSQRPYGVVRDLLYRRFGILDSDSPADAQRKWLDGFSLVAEGRTQEHAALLGQLVGLDFRASPHISGILEDSKQLRNRAFYAGAEFFSHLRVGANAAISLFFDDLHWADEGSLDFLDYIIDACRDQPLLIVCGTRPDLLERRSLGGDQPSQQQRIDLLELSASSSQQLVAALLQRMDQPPDALVKAITEGAEGNPFYMEELTKMLIDDGVIVTGAGRWQVIPERVASLRVPPTLTGVLQARMDILSEPARTALQAAAVVGSVFWDEALKAVDAALADPLDALQASNFVHARATTAFEHAREFAFDHQLLHRVTYDSVLKRRKRQYHQHAADWLVEQTAGRNNEYVGLVATHYECAGDRRNAAIYLRLAGELAARTYSNATALDFLKRALAVIPEDDAATRFALLRTRRLVHFNTGMRAEHRADVEALEALAEELDDDASRAVAAGYRSSLELVCASYAAAVSAAERAVGWADAAGDPAAALGARLNWGRALHFLGDSAGARTHLEHALALAREVGNLELEIASLTQLGIIECEQGRYGLGRVRYQAALEIARRTNDRAREAILLNNLGDNERMLGNYDVASELFSAGRQLFADIGQHELVDHLAANLAFTAFLQGEPGVAIEWTVAALDGAVRKNDRNLRAVLLCFRGHAYAALERWDDAADHYRESAAIYREIGRATIWPEPTAGLARVALARGNVAEAMDTIAGVLSYLDSGGVIDGTEDPLWIHLTCHQVLAAGRDARALTFLQRGYDVLMKRAALLSDAERSTFLEKVASHSAIVAAWSSVASHAQNS